jgi:DNA-binding LacI/PurR family transcriptional regulator
MISEKNARKSTTIYDIAHRLNVSHTTIRRALLGLPGVSEETRQRVQEIAVKMKYRPNLLAKGLKSQKANFIGLIITKSINESWYANIIDAIVNTLKQQGYSVLLSLSRLDHPEEEKQCVDELMGGHVAGIIVGPLLRSSDMTPYADAVLWGPPMVVFGCIEPMPVSYVAIDHTSGMKDIVDCLLQLGHKRIGYVCCPNEFLTPNTRRFGLQQALFEKGLQLEERDIIIGRPTFEDGYRVTSEYIEKKGGDLPTAMFCHCDDVALGTMKALYERGISVPKDISLVGHDDIRAANYSTPGLATIGGIIKPMAENIVNLLMNSINDGKSTPQKIFIKPGLIKRGSIGIARDNNILKL